MRLELEESDIQAIAREITAEVIKVLKPLMNGKVEEDTILTVKTLAPHLGVSEKWVYERVQHKEIPFLKVKGNVRFRKNDIDSWLENLKTPVVNPLSAPLKRIK